MKPALPLYVPEHAEYTKQSILSSDGKTELALYRFVPINVPVRAVVQIVHGMTEYLLRYTKIIDFLCENGFEVWGHDHLGHGNSVRNPEDLGFMDARHGADYMIEDTHLVSNAIRAELPGLPLFLLGHSMGSFVVRNYTARWGDELAGAVYVGTGGPNSPTGIGCFVASLIGLFCGKRHRSALLRKIAFSGYLKTYEKGCSPNAWLTNDPAGLAVYADDPYCNYTFTVRGYHDLFTLLGRVSKKAWARSLPKDMPVLFLSGDDDPVGQWGKGVTAVYDRLLEAGMTDVTLKLYAGSRHEVLTDKDREAVRADLLSWLCDRLSGTV